MLHAGVHHEQRQPGGIEAEVDDLDLEAAAVEQDRRVGGAEDRGHLVHDPRGGADGLVLGAPPHAGQSGAVEPELPQIVQRDGDGAFDGRRRRQAGADGHVRRDGDVEPGRMGGSRTGAASCSAQATPSG